ncbi:MAG: hypothetical protein LBN43_00275 [Oscillospiraceae bacterium]|nr:hypothetical protein [Oscillospiraceae bacterium]
MTSSSLKTYFIVLLVIVNLLFIGLVVTDVWDVTSSEALGQDDLALIYQNSGVELAEDAYDSKADRLAGGRVTRTGEAELSFTERVLGVGTKAEDRGGSNVYYIGTNGIANFRADGYFEITLPHSSSGGKKSLYAQAEEFAGTLGLKLGKLSTAGRSLSYVLLRGDTEVINQYVKFEFGIAGGVTISGVYVLGDETETGAYDYADIFTASLKFLREIEASGILCGSVTGIKGVYIFESSAYVPAWRFDTDAGVFILNAISGELYQE